MDLRDRLVAWDLQPHSISVTQRGCPPAAGWCPSQAGTGLLGLGVSGDAAPRCEGRSSPSVLLAVALLEMCGEEDDYTATRPNFPLISGHTCCRLGVHFNDVVTIFEEFGDKPRIGYFEDFDDKWGAAIIWMDGSRTWYPWDRWDAQKYPGWRFELAGPDLFIRDPDFAVAPKEQGRGRLPRPPLSAQPRAKKMTLWQAHAAVGAYATGQLCYVAKAQLCKPVEDSPSRPEGLRLTSNTAGDRSSMYSTGLTSDSDGDRS